MDAESRDLIADRLRALDAARERQTKPLRYCYIGMVKPGEIATPPNNANVCVIRAGDPLPEGTSHYVDRFRVDLQRWFESATTQTGINVWRWK